MTFLLLLEHSILKTVSWWMLLLVIVTYICFPEMLSPKFFFKLKDEIPIILPTV